MKYCTLALGLVLALAFGACSSTTPSTPPDYYKGIDKIGSYWIYQNQEIDTNWQVKSEVLYTDSTWVQGIQLIDGKQATMLLSYSIQNGRESYDTNYVYRDGSKLWVYMKPPPIPLDTTLRVPTWSLLVNPEATGSWIVFDTVRLQRDVNLGTDLTLKAKAWMDNRGADSTLVLPTGTSYKCKEAVVKLNIEATLTPKTFPIPITISVTGGNRRYFFSDGVARVAELVEPMTISVAGNLFPPQKQPGSYRTMLRYHLAQ